MTIDEPPLLHADRITKRFGDRAALQDVTLDVGAGRVHAVLGENGAGKSTLMNILFGFLAPDAGTLRWRGRAVEITSPAVARSLGIGMVHQHFLLVPALTVWENVWLAHPARSRWLLHERRARATMRDLEGDLGLDLDARVADLPMGHRQRVEIAKALTSDLSLLILDEPTAVLAPSETADLFRVVERLRARGCGVLFITHRLDEVAISDRVTVLRRGRVVAEYGADTGGSADPARLARDIVGSDAGWSSASGRATSEPEDEGVISVADLHDGAARVPLRAVEFRVGRGEIFAIAGIDGNGQDELVRLLAGIARPTRGRIALRGTDVTRLTPRARWERGLTVVPADRARNGLVLDAPLWENLALREFGARWARGRLGVEARRHRDRATTLLAEFGVDTTNPNALARELSGGNQQKVLLARELASSPDAIVVVNPTRGLDVRAAEAVLALLRRRAAGGAAVIVVSTDLDEVLAIGTRCAVLNAGRLLPADRGDRDAIGARMLERSQP